jgi:hypothetical protein
VALIRHRRHPCLENNRKRQNLRHKSHSRAPATPDNEPGTGIFGGFDDNGFNGIVAFQAQDLRCERKTFDRK